MKLLEQLKQIAADVVPSYRFEYEATKMENVKADDGKFPLIFFEEYVNKDGRYSQRYGWKKHQPVELYFLKLAPFQADAVTREALRDEIEVEAVLPFLEGLNDAQVFENIEDVRVTAVPPMFDSNAVGLLLTFDVVFNVCKLTPLK